MNFATERLFPDLFGEMVPLLERHWDEVALKDAFGPVDVNEDAYRQIEEAGCLHVTTARESGRLVGYAVYFIVPNLHYRTRLVAEADVFFLLPEYRQGLAGLRLMQAADRALVERGVDIIISKVKTAHDCGRLFERMGYRLAEKNYMRIV